MLDEDMVVRDFVACDLLGRFRVMHVFDNRPDCFIDASSIHLGVDIHESDLRMIPTSTRTYNFDGVKKEVNFCNLEKFCSRTLLQKTVDELKEQGFEVFMGVEPEFYLLNKDGTVIDNKQYMFHVYLSGFEHDLVKLMKQVGLEPTRYHHEVGPSQYEFGFKYADPVTTADNLIMFKMIVHQLAAKHGIKATFHPKPFDGLDGKPLLAGNGMHTHVSVWCNGENLFSASNDFVQSFTEGLLAHAKEMTVIFAPDEESYKRLGASEAPKNICVGANNRSALIRIPSHSSTKSATIEFRAPHPQVNPYLVFAVLIRAGMDGVAKNMKMREMLQANAYKTHGIEALPGSLQEAVEIARTSDFLKNALGNEIYDRFMKAVTSQGH